MSTVYGATVWLIIGIARTGENACRIYITTVGKNARQLKRKVNDFMADFRDEYVDIYLNGTKRQIVRGIYQYDHGLKLRVHGLPTTSIWQMQYGCVGNLEAVTVLSE